MTWQKGQSGNPAGRKVGIREHLTKEFVADLADAWKKDGADALQRLVKDDPASFCKLAAQLIPKEHKISHDVNAITDLLKLVTRRQLEALEARKPKERVIEHKTESLSHDTLKSFTEES